MEICAHKVALAEELTGSSTDDTFVCVRNVKTSARAEQSGSFKPNATVYFLIWVNVTVLHEKHQRAAALGASRSAATLKAQTA